MELISILQVYVQRPIGIVKVTCTSKPKLIILTKNVILVFRVIFILEHESGEALEV